MARTRITPLMVKEINEKYLKSGVKAQVAREMGISASTVTKYIVAGYVSEDSIVREKLNLSSIQGKIDDFLLSKKDFENELILCLSKEEEEKMPALWKEMSL